MDNYYLTRKGDVSAELPAASFEQILLDASDESWLPEHSLEEDEPRSCLAPYFRECEVSEFDSDDLAKALITVEKNADFVGRPEYEKALLEMIRVSAQGAFSIHRG